MADDAEPASGAADAGGPGDGGASSAAKPRHKRTRTGCLKCRIRRRKCDEGKPQCRRCLEGNFECQYGPRLTFLNKNALTVSPSTQESKPVAAPRYSRLQFVNPGTSRQDAKDTLASPASEPLQSTPTTDNAPVITSPSASHTPIVTTFQVNLNSQPPHPPTPKPHPVEPRIVQNHHPAPPQWRAPSLVHDVLSSPARNLDITTKLPGPSPNNDAAYETALNVLLSLGSEGTTGLVQSPDHGSASFALGNGMGGLSPRDLVSVSPSSISDRRDSSVMYAPTAPLSQDRLLQLIRHFRYHVAPWLDLCDMGQTFGLHVPRLAIESEGVSHALLAMAATAQQADLRTHGDAGYLRSLAESAPIKQSGTTTIDDAELAQVALLTACRFISDVPDAWAELHLLDEGFWSVALNTAGPKTVAILSVLVRLQLAAALVTGSPMTVPDQLTPDPTSHSWTSSVVAETIFQSAIEPLLLCARVVNLCAGVVPPPLPSAAADHDLGPPPPLPTPVHHWTLLLDALNLWYANRAQEFRPMVEMDGDENLFPVILFTNGAAVFANQLYHTAVLLLLQNKPRTWQASSAGSAGGGGGGGSKRTSLSPLWHAQRVCGIALNNDRRDSWDPSLVASLYLAARRCSYEPQQRAVLECLERVKTLTGWNVDGFSVRVREDWGLL
ncbi:Sterol uptake control protein 2 [Colletotrichum sidae]|uniref:Sterol uptake control protein 2 n=1 Tax=Colletotrichum sidae TaxID=1347389 RepID=A0A4R8TC59_9PEZI|nr:Sterol uptake control protein 2 [Colletotrichum sidae]